MCFRVKTGTSPECFSSRRFRDTVTKMPLLFIAILGVYQVLLFFVHSAVYKSIVDAFGWDPAWLAWAFGVLSLTFVISSLVVYRYSNAVTRTCYRVSSYWFGLVHFLFVGSFFFYLLELIFYGRDVYVSPALLGVITLGGMFLIHVYASWRTGKPQMTRIDVALPHLPDVWKGKKIVFVSDIHLGAIWTVGFAERIAAIIRSENPEVVLIGGDLFDGVKCDPEALAAPLAALRPPRGIFYVTGNHEYVNGGIDVFMKSIRKMPFRVLENEAVDVAGLQFAGVDWKDTVGAEPYRQVLADIKIDAAKPSILIKHEPSELAVGEAAGFSLQLSGHTHQGQIFPLQLVTRRVYHGFDYGLKRFGRMEVFTSSGAGTWGPPLRFGTKSEIVAVTLKQA